MFKLTTLLWRGLLSGFIAGAASAVFSYFLAEPLMDRAVELESAREAAEQPAAGLMMEHHAEIFSRSTQHAGLLVATIATGLALGAIYAVVYWVIQNRGSGGKPWAFSLHLAGYMFYAVWLLPFIRYPSMPPGAGDPATVDFRSELWLAAMAIGVASTLCAWRLLIYLKRRGISKVIRELSVAAILIAGLGLSFALPSNPDVIEVPASLLWDFRLLSLASMLILWSVLGASFGFLGSRAAARIKAGL